MLDLFTLLKSIHVIAVGATISGFALRGYWMIRESALRDTRLARTLPHVNDTVLLLSALGAAALLDQYPFVDIWLTAKVAGLLAYIVLGAIALTYGKTKKIRTAAFIGSLLSFAYVVGVALTKNPLILL